MPKPRAKQTQVVDIAEMRPVLAPRPVRRRRSRTVETRLGWAVRIISALQIPAIVLAACALYTVHGIETETRAGFDRGRKDLQNIAAQVDFQSKRQRLLLGIRDEILKTNRKLALSDAYDFAELALQACDKYPAVDPLLIVSVGIVESGYDTRATSSANARGLYQIWPATGRTLARVLQWEYTDEMLYDPARNTELAALYLDILFATYRDQRMVLAEYNGGPLNAGYLRAGSSRIALETRDYVLKVMDVHERLKAQFAQSTDAGPQRFHEDPGRRGKSLAQERPDSRRGGSKRSARTVTSSDTQ